MPNIKTAVSLDKTLFSQINQMAQVLNISRSRLFSLAAKEFIQKHQNQKLLDAINSAYDDMPDPEEQKIYTKMRNKHKRMVKNQW